MRNWLRIHGISSAWLVLVALAASAQEPERVVLDGERLARAYYYEGVPYLEARNLSDLDVERLIELLEDPGEARFHANVIAALGMSGSADAFPAIRVYLQLGTSGELDRTRFRGLRAAPLAMGHLARDDTRALRWLMDAAELSGHPPQRHFRRMGPARVRRQLRRAAMTGLALSGDTEARALLVRLAAATDRPRMAAHARESLALHRRIVREGPEAVMTGDES